MRTAMMLVWLCGFMSFTLAEKMESSIQDALYRFEMKGEFKKAIAILENVISEGDNEDKEKASFYLGKIQELAGNRQSANLYYKQSLQRNRRNSRHSRNHTKKFTATKIPLTQGF